MLDAAGHRFGGFATEAWEPAQRYFGTGESFLFRATPSLAVYHWTGANTHFQLGSLDSIAMGGGGHFGLWLDEVFEYGSSGPCETYGNPRLSSADSFRIIRVELWELIAAEALSPRTSCGGALAGSSSCDSPLCDRRARQGSSAFLLNMLRPGVGL